MIKLNAVIIYFYFQCAWITMNISTSGGLTLLLYHLWTSLPEIIHGGLYSFFTRSIFIRYLKEWNVKEVAMLMKMLVSSERLFKKHSEHVAENSATFLVKIPNLFFLVM